MTELLKEKIVFDDTLIIERADLRDEDNKEYSRLRVNREDTAAVLILNTDTNKVILTRQYRYAIASRTDEDILEIAAGKVEDETTALKTVITETEQETGYRLNLQRIKFLTSCFASPGYSSERFFIYMATVENADKVSKGGGKKSENEHIEIVELDADEFIRLIKDGGIKDAKTYIAGLHFIQGL